MECLTLAMEQHPEGHFRQSLVALNTVVGLELPLSRAMGLLPNVFPADFVTIVRYGEIYGELDVVLERLLDRPQGLHSRAHA